MKKLRKRFWSNRWPSGKTDLVWYESAEQMLFECDGRYPFDLIILDIQMKETTGMELARKIRQTDAQVPILFLTAIKEYVFEGYEAQSSAVSDQTEFRMRRCLLS